jgi:hypothetical protein
MSGSASFPSAKKSGYVARSLARAVSASASCADTPETHNEYALAEWGAPLRRSLLARTRSAAVQSPGLASSKSQ